MWSVQTIKHQQLRNNSQFSIDKHLYEQLNECTKDMRNTQISWKAVFVDIFSQNYNNISN